MLSPQGYNTPEPSNTNPFWGEGEDQDVNRIYATAEITGGTGTPSVQTSKTVSGHDITFGFSFNNLKGETGAQGERGLQGIQGERGPAGPAGEQGPAGATGATGPAGQDGVSPTIDVVTVTGGHRVDITDAQGSESFTIPDGQDGQNGQDGVTPDIAMSATADATSSANPTVTVTKSGTTANPAFALAFSGLKGEQGIQGPAGAAGSQGPAGQDGVTPDITMSATADATSSANPTVTVTKSGTTANPAFALAFSGLKGETGATGATGSQGPQGEQGPVGPQGPAGPGVPAGGTAGQVLVKIDGTDYNTEWITPSGGGGGGLQLIATLPYGQSYTIKDFLDLIRNNTVANDVIYIEGPNTGNHYSENAVPISLSGENGGEQLISIQFTTDAPTTPTISVQALRTLSGSLNIYRFYKTEAHVVGGTTTDAIRLIGSPKKALDFESLGYGTWELHGSELTAENQTGGRYGHEGWIKIDVVTGMSGTVYGTFGETSTSFNSPGLKIYKLVKS